MPANLGAAGAWAAGLEYAALQRGHDWVWSFDDDSVPGPEALGTLLDVQPNSRGNGRGNDNGSATGETGLIAMLPVHGATGIAYPPLLWRDGFHKPAGSLMRDEVWFADLAIASGLLVRREVVERIGLPRADFFMDFFDFEYCLRARSGGFRIAVEPRAELAHEVGEARLVRLPGLSALWPNHAPWREYYMSRNMVYVAWWIRPSALAKGMTLRHLLRHAGGSLLFGEQKLACVKKMIQGFFDGRKANLGIRFLPAGSLPQSLAGEPAPLDGKTGDGLRSIRPSIPASLAQKG
jgi:GT2 family glycosyltransferase